MLWMGKEGKSCLWRGGGRGGAGELLFKFWPLIIEEAIPVNERRGREAIGIAAQTFRNARTWRCMMTAVSRSRALSIQIFTKCHLPLMMITATCKLYSEALPCNRLFLPTNDTA